jgi:hypothetical protein
MYIKTFHIQYAEELDEDEHSTSVIFILKRAQCNHVYTSIEIEKIRIPKESPTRQN